MGGNSSTEAESKRQEDEKRRRETESLVQRLDTTLDLLANAESKRLEDKRRRREIESKRQEEERRRREIESKRQEEERRRREIESKRQEEEKKRRDDESKRQEEEKKRRDDEIERLSQQVKLLRTELATAAPTPPPNLLTERPWRSFDVAQQEKNILEDIKKLKPQKIPGVLMLGPVGAGKSSFINSCLSVASGRKRIKAQTGSDDGSYTLKFNTFKGLEWLQNIRFMDSMGIEGASTSGIHEEDVTNLLQGYIKKGYKFNQEKPIDEKNAYYNKEPEFEDKTHCVVFVIDAKTMDAGIPTEHVEKIKTVQKAIKNADIPRVLILTKCDLLCSKVKEDADNIFSSIRVERAVKAANEVFGIDMSSIHPVINYEVDIVLSTAKNVPILLALRQILQYACDYVEDNLDD